jgi:hypothetical protein
MVAVISENLRIFNAEQFKESVSEPASSKVYFTFGRGYSWANDSAPQQANSSVTVFNEVWDNMIGAKLITGNDIRHVTLRYDWSANTVYPAYDHCICSLQLFAPNTPFYVVTTDWNVYKCLANNAGANSTVMPTSISTTSPSETSDGYIWKYMYTISADERMKFTTDSYIPVKTLSQDDGSLQWDVQANSVPGAINVIRVTNGGNNYTNAATITITITGDGTGATATANVNTISNTVSTISVTNPGRDYTYAEVNITVSGSGSGAAARAIISPPGGHGSDPLRELGGSYLMINPRLRGSENGVLPVNNEYRQISLISDPLVFESANIESNTVVSQLTILTLNGTSSEYIEDEIVYQGASLSTSTFRGRVYQWDSPNNVVKLTNTLGIPTTDILIGANSTGARFVDSVTNPTMRKYSGELLYIDNIKPISRDADQTEDYKITFSF